MLEGFTNFQTARGRNPDSIAKQLSTLTGLAAWAKAWPWQWTPELIDAWSAYLKAERKLARSTLRGRQGAARLFVSYLVNPAYAWTTRCRELFGVAPTQVCFDWNTTRHLEAYEGTPERRPLDDDEKQRLFAAAGGRCRWCCPGWWRRWASTWSGCGPSCPPGRGCSRRSGWTATSERIRSATCTCGGCSGRSARPPAWTSWSCRTCCGTPISPTWRRVAATCAGGRPRPATSCSAPSRSTIT